MTTECDMLAALPTEQLCWLDSFAFRPYVMNRRSGQTIRRPIAPVIDRGHGNVAVIDVQGVLVRDAFWSDKVSTGSLTELLNQAANDDAISAVVLNIDSPSGTVSGMAELMDAAKALAAKKPLYAQVADYCCSAAYELACAATKIYAGKRTTVGSIGTRILLYDLSRFFEKEGIEAVAIDTGEFKSIGALGTEITERHREYLQRFVDQAQADFAAIVQESRGLAGKAYAAVADGRVFWAEEAVPLGLIDGVQTLTATIQEAEAFAARSSITPRSTKRMSEELQQLKTVGPEPATLAELKENLPGASSEFLLEQLEKKATLPEAMKTYFAVQQAENERLAQEKAEAEARMVEAEKKAEEKAASTAPKKRGNQAIAQSVGDADETGIDFRQLAQEYQKAHRCRWSEACLAIKRKYPESRPYFGAPSVD